MISVNFIYCHIYLSFCGLYFTNILTIWSILLIFFIISNLFNVFIQILKLLGSPYYQIIANIFFSGRHDRFKILKNLFIYIIIMVKRSLLTLFFDFLCYNSNRSISLNQSILHSLDLRFVKFHNKNISFNSVIIKHLLGMVANMSKRIISFLSYDFIYSYQR